MRALRASRQQQADLAIILLAVTWGGSFVLVKQALGDSSPLLFLAMRFTIAACALAVLLRGRIGPIGGTELRAGLVTGTCLAAGFIFQTTGLRLTTPSKSAFVTSLYIVTVPLLGAFVYRMKPRWPELAGVAAAGMGMMLLTQPEGKFVIEGGDLLTLGGAVSFAFHILSLSHYAPKVGYEALALLQVVAVAAICGSTFFWVETPFVRWSPFLFWALMLSGIIFTALGFAVQSWAQQYTPATRAALLFSMEPVFAALYSSYFLGEVLSARGLAGAALILAGVVFVELKPVAKPVHQVLQAAGISNLQASGGTET